MADDLETLDDLTQTPETLDDMTSVDLGRSMQPMRKPRMSSRRGRPPKVAAPAPAPTTTPAPDPNQAGMPIPAVKPSPAKYPSLQPGYKPAPPETDIAPAISNFLAPNRFQGTLPARPKFTPVTPPSAPAVGPIGQKLTPGDVITQQQLKPRPPAVIRAETPAETYERQQMEQMAEPGVEGAFARGYGQVSAGAMQDISGAARLLANIGRYGAQGQPAGPTTSMLDRVADWFASGAYDRSMSVANAERIRQGLEPVNPQTLGETIAQKVGAAGFDALKLYGLSRLTGGMGPAMATQQVLRAGYEGVTDPAELVARAATGAIEGKVFGRLGQLPARPSRVLAQGLAGATQPLAESMTFQGPRGESQPAPTLGQMAEAGGTQALMEAFMPGPHPLAARPLIPSLAEAKARLVAAGIAEPLNKLPQGLQGSLPNLYMGLDPTLIRQYLPRAETIKRMFTNIFGPDALPDAAQKNIDDQMQEVAQRLTQTVFDRRQELIRQVDNTPFGNYGAVGPVKPLKWGAHPDVSWASMAMGAEGKFYLLSPTAEGKFSLVVPGEGIENFATAEEAKSYADTLERIKSENTLPSGWYVKEHQDAPGRFYTTQDPNDNQPWSSIYSESTPQAATAALNRRMGSDWRRDQIARIDAEYKVVAERLGEWLNNHRSYLTTQARQRLGPGANLESRTGAGAQGLFMHNIDPDRLLGQIQKGTPQPSPSIAVVHPETNFSSFGGVTLIGTPEMVFKPGERAVETPAPQAGGLEWPLKGFDYDNINSPDNFIRTEGPTGHVFEIRPFQSDDGRIKYHLSISTGPDELAQTVFVPNPVFLSVNEARQVAAYYNKMFVEASGQPPTAITARRAEPSAPSIFPTDFYTPTASSVLGYGRELTPENAPEVSREMTKQKYEFLEQRLSDPEEVFGTPALLAAYTKTGGAFPNREAFVKWLGNLARGASSTSTIPEFAGTRAALDDFNQLRAEFDQSLRDLKNGALDRLAQKQLTRRGVEYQGGPETPESRAAKVLERRALQDRWNTIQQEVTGDVNKLLLVTAAKDPHPDVPTLINDISKITDKYPELAKDPKLGELNHDLADQALRTFKAFREAPSVYGEAQPERPVSLSEYVAALIPSSKNIGGWLETGQSYDKVAAALEAEGMRVYRYGTPEEKIQYQQALAQFKDLVADPNSSYGALYSNPMFNPDLWRRFLRGIGGWFEGESTRWSERPMTEAETDRDGVRLGPATWRAQGSDYPVQVEGLAGVDSEGRRYVRVKGSGTAVPEDELQYPARQSEQPLTSEQKAALDPNDPNYELNLGRSSNQQAVADTIDNSMDKAIKEAQTAYTRDYGEYQKAVDARTQARRRLRNLEALKATPEFLDPVRAADLDQAIELAKKDRATTLTAGKEARSKMLVSREGLAGAQTDVRRQQLGEAAAARLLTPEISYPVPPDTPFFEEIVDTSYITPSFLKAAKDVMLAEGRPLDKNKFVLPQLLDWAREGRIPLTQLADAFERQGVEPEEFFNTLSESISKGARSMAYLSHIRRQANALAKTNPELAKKLEAALPALTEINKLYRERSNLDRFMSIYSGALTSLWGTAARNLEASELVVGFDSLHQLLDSGVQKIFGAEAFGNKATLSPSLAIKPILNFWGEIGKSIASVNFRQNSGKVSRVMAAFEEAFPKEVHEPLVSIMDQDNEMSKLADGQQYETTGQILQRWKQEANALPEDSARKPKLLAAIADAEKRYAKSQGLLGRGLIRVEKLVYAINLFNRAQETIVRRAVFEAKVRRYAWEGGYDVDQMVEDGTLKELPIEIVKRAADESLVQTFAKRAVEVKNPQTISDYVSDSLYHVHKGLTRGPIGAAVRLGIGDPFINFLGNIVKFQYDYSPAGLIGSPVFSAKSRAKMGRGDYSTIWKGLTGIALYGMFSQMRHDYYNSQGSQMGPDEEPWWQKYPRKPWELIGTPFTAGEKWYELKIADRNIDLRFTPFSAAALLADMQERNRRGLGSITGGDIISALGGSMRGVDQLGEAIGDAIQGIRDAEKMADAWKIGGRWLGAITAGFLTPLKYISDFGQLWSPGEAVKRDVKQEEGFGSSFRAAIQERTPFWRQQLPEEESPTREAAPAKSDMLKSEFTGLPFIEPKNWLEEQMDTLGIKPYEIVPHINNDRADRVIRREMGKFMEGLGDTLKNEPAFTTLPAEQRREMLLDYIFPSFHNSVRDQALAEIPEELLKAEIAKAFTKEQRNVEDRRRKVEGRPTLLEETKGFLQPTPAPTPEPETLDNFTAPTPGIPQRPAYIPATRPR